MKYCLFRCYTLILTLLAGMTMAPPAGAQDTRPTFGLPLACTPGVDCWVMNYVDIGPDGDGRGIDPLCGTRTYDGNKGTSFALANTARIESGVPVLAARDGKIVRVRDGVDDNLAPTAQELSGIKDAQKECGNAILIDHGNGLQSLYCYLKNGSITVANGEAVKRGDRIAQVGMSGYTAFPQLHFGIVWEGAVVDPFTGLNANDQCGGRKSSLWDQRLGLMYEPVRFYGAGFTTDEPALDMLDRGAGNAPETIGKDVPVLAFWTTLFGMNDGDMLSLTITAPDGTLFSRRRIQQKENKTRQLYYTGRRLDGGLLMPGIYTGTAVLSRMGEDGTTQEWNTTTTITVQGE